MTGIIPKVDCTFSCYPFNNIVRAINIRTKQLPSIHEGYAFSTKGLQSFVYPESITKMFDYLVLSVYITHKNSHHLGRYAQLTFRLAEINGKPKRLSSAPKMSTLLVESKEGSYSFLSRHAGVAFFNR